MTPTEPDVIILTSDSTIPTVSIDHFVFEVPDFKSTAEMARYIIEQAPNAINLPTFNERIIVYLFGNFYDHNGLTIAPIKKGW